MSTSLLYQGFGIRGYHYVRTDYFEGEVMFTIVQERHTLRCSACGSQHVTAHGSEPRLFHNLPIGSKKTQIFLQIPRVECHDCHVTRQVHINFAEPRRRYTHAFERFALDLAQHMTIQDVARHLGVAWDTIKDIQKRYLEKHFAKPELKHLRLLAIDEIAVGKGHRYLTVVLDLESGAVVFVGDGKGAEALAPFWQRLRRSRANIEAVALDMSPAYIFAVHENLPQAALVFDRFHVVKLFNERLSDFRRELHNEATDRLHKNVLKGTRWLLLKNPDNLAPEHRERERLEEALRLNQPLATAYYMKEDLRQIWEQPDKATAARVLRDWIRRAEESGIKILHKMAATLGTHRNGILAHYDYPISTGPLEGTNNKIKTMQRQAYGFRDHEFFKLKIYALHKTKYALVG
ncbi:MAG: ISL3 family transposase [Candidatus Sulfotelmatobacter sp.]